MISTNQYASIAALDLHSISSKLMHADAGEGWSLEKTKAVEAEYRRFLYLMKIFPREETSPLEEVDIFWHCHILDTMKYAADCRLVFGYFLHHDPYLGLRGEGDEAVLQRYGERMRELYEQTFGAVYGEYRSTCCAAPGDPIDSAMNKPAYCAVPTVTACCAAPPLSASYRTVPAASARDIAATPPAYGGAAAALAGRLH